VDYKRGLESKLREEGSGSGTSEVLGSILGSGSGSGSGSGVGFEGIPTSIDGSSSNPSGDSIHFGIGGKGSKKGLENDKFREKEKVRNDISSSAATSVSVTIVNEDYNNSALSGKNASSTPQRLHKYLLSFLMKLTYLFYFTFDKIVVLETLDQALYQF